MSIASNLAGTQRLADKIDQTAREGAPRGRSDFARHVERVDPALLAADLSATIITVQGAIGLADYLRTRCVEAVVHGQDFQPAVAADDVAQAVTSQSLLMMLAGQPDMLAAARALPTAAFIDYATGRAPAPSDLGSVFPLMT